MNQNRLGETLRQLVCALAQALKVLVLFLAVAFTALLLILVRALPYVLILVAVAAYVAGGILTFSTWVEIYGGGLDAIAVGLALVLLVALVPFWTFATSQSKLAEIFGAVILAALLFGVQFGIGRLILDFGLQSFASIIPCVGLVLATFLILQGGQNEKRSG